MQVMQTGVLHHGVIVLMIASQLALPGCATIFRGSSQPVRVATYPAGGAVVYQGSYFHDGQVVPVNKRFANPQFMVAGENAPLPVDMTFDPDPWLLGDAALCLVFVVPGLVAFGVDFATGSWRNLREVQAVTVPELAKQAATR